MRRIRGRSLFLVVVVWVSALFVMSWRLYSERKRRLRDFGAENFRSPPFVPQALPLQLILLTTFFVPRGDVPGRAEELEATLLANVNLGVFDEIHLLVSPGDVGSLPLSLLHGHPEVRVTETRPGELSRLTPKKSGNNSHISNAMLHSDFFAFANKRLTGRIVVIANADIEFDKSITRIRTEGEIARGNHRAGYAISRENPHCPLLEHCNRRPWCLPSLCNEDYAWYDAFVIVPPMSQSFISSVNYHQDMLGSDNVVVAHMGDSLFMTNPCQDVRIIHRHCFRNFSTVASRKLQFIDGIATIIGCQHQPLSPPPGQVDV